jgi:membrane-bound serine protease (ClpP class)
MKLGERSMHRQRRWIAWLLAAALLLGARPQAQAQSEALVLVLEAKGALTPAMAEYLDRGLRLAEARQAEALVLQLDTPGGSIELMNRMVQSIRGSQVPVIVFVAPRGAIAGSAGTILVLAGHAAAMAPETAIGAASPVGSQGEDLGETMEAKEKEILKAEARGLAERRGETAMALAEAAIESASAASSTEALQAGLVDRIASDVPDLLRQIDGLTVEVDGQEHVLKTAWAFPQAISQTLTEQLLQILTNPNIVLLLMTVGVQSILIEISSPGGWAAGFIGVICLALGGYGLGILDVNWFGLVFLIMAFVLFVLDIKAPTHGALTVAGVASFVAGALILFNSPGTPSFQRVSVPLVVGLGLFTAAGFFVMLTFVLRAHRRPVEVGREALVGRTGEARSTLEPSGMVQVAGELWSAEIEPGTPAIATGERVEVVSVRGLRLLVRPAPRGPVDAGSSKL